MKRYGYCSVKTGRQSYVRQQNAVQKAYPGITIVKEQISEDEIPQAFKMLTERAEEIIFYEPYNLGSSLEQFVKNLNLMISKKIAWKFIRMPFLDYDFLSKNKVPQSAYMTILQGAFLTTKNEFEAAVEKRESAREGAELSTGKRGRPVGSGGLSAERLEEMRKALLNRGFKTDKDLIKELGISDKTYYKYKKRFREMQKKEAEEKN